LPHRLTHWFVHRPGGITRDTYKEVLSKLEDQNLNNGIILMNRRTAKEFLSWDRSEIGGDLAQDLFKQGLSARLANLGPRLATHHPRYVARG
jgi:hypothetical protein